MTPSQPDPRFRKPETLYFVIGAQKCGTTWLSDYFRTHPEICAPLWKEHDYWRLTEGRGGLGHMLAARKARRDQSGPLVNWFRDIGPTLGARKRRAARRAIAAAMAPGAPHKDYADCLISEFRKPHLAAGEVCPSYAQLTPETYREMAALSDNVRFVFVMRDPVARFISGVLHAMRKTHDLAALTEAELNSEVDRCLELAEDSGAVQLSRYDLTMERLEASVSRDHIKYVFFENLFAQDQVDAICEFLGVANHPAKFSEVRNEGRGKQVKVDLSRRKRIARMLVPAYSRLDEIFGADLPDKWRVSMEMLKD